MKLLNKYIIGIISIFSLVLSISAFSIDDAKGIDPMGWDEVFLLAKTKEQLSSYFTSYTESKMYEQRDFFRSTEYSQLTYDIYEHWGEIRLNSTTVPLIATFMNNYNSKINSLIYNQNIYDIFIDQELFDVSIELLDYHKRLTLSSDYLRFDQDVRDFLIKLKGKNNLEVRDILFVAPRCTITEQEAGYC